LVAHFYDSCAHGKRNPNLYFDTAWYLHTYPDIVEGGLNPLYHYLTVGEPLGRSPSLLFDPTSYRTRYGLPDDVSLLGHYLAHRMLCEYSPIPEFDATYYASNYPDIAAAGIDPFEHYLLWGFKEGRNPSARFNTRFYIQRYLNNDPSENPLVHYLRHRGTVGGYEILADGAETVHREIRKYTSPGELFEDFSPTRGRARRAKVLAYYLPQFHSFPENDAWWGKGFTEWTNITRGIPRFKGHYQPRVPRDLGFYMLDSNEPMRRQVEMAKAAGVFGFVFYYYWFNGKRLLDAPLERFLADNTIDMPFCLMWANENWTRRWDGSEAEILISQDYRSDDNERLVEDFERHFRDPRYIRVQQRPVLMIYRPSLIPDPRNTIDRWRSLWRSKFEEDPLLVMAQSFDHLDPRPYGLDGAIEFPPHKLTRNLADINAEIEYLDPDFSGRVYRYDDLVQVSLGESTPSFPLIKTVVPNWDNDARRQGRGVTVTGSTPAQYEAWLSAVIDRAVDAPFFDEPFVCVNGWNEWCEGAYLEPDLHFGSAYLNATARAVAGRLGAADELSCCSSAMMLSRAVHS
jgi:hypothetical protein